ncbi:MAG: thioredoxin family protein [Bdellovibrionaceae bacterium]|nr:thioredoxin family protein [Pseudobdellovibrionaceae bacterium]
MKTLVTLLALTLAIPAFAQTEIKVDSPAPAFSVKDASGKAHSLADAKGKWVVLEWYNKDCPYVRKHYDSKNMQGLQTKYMAQGVTWYTVISSATGKQGFLANAEVAPNFTKEGAKPTAVLIDTDGAMGKAYGAKTTPHMYVINPEGKVVYAGAIDDNNSANPKVIPTSKNFVAAALEAGMAGKPVETKATAAYGCAVKYN